MTDRPHRAGTWLLAMLLGAVLAACTPGMTGDPEPVPSTSGAPAPGTTTTSSAPSALSAPSTLSTLSAPSVPLAPLGPAATAPAGSGAAGTAVAAAEALVPGLYGLDSLRPHPHGSAIDLSIPESCAFAMDVIASGQWAARSITTPHTGSSSYLTVLTRGEKSALLSLDGTDTYCEGRIVAAAQQQFDLSGAVVAHGPAQAATVLCRSTIDEDHPGAHVIVMSYATATGGFLAIFGATDKVGAQPVDPDDAAALVVLDPKKPALVQAATAAAGMFDPTQYSADGSLPGVDDSQGWIQGDGATVTITKANPLTGVLTAPAMTNESGKPGQLSLTAGFRCD